MTLDDLMTRAQRVWGRARVSSIRRRADGGADVNCLPAGIASDTRDRNYVGHGLDATGAVDCHDDCRELEKERDGAG